MIGHGDIARAVSLGAEAVKLGDAIEPWRWSTAARPCVLVKASRQIYLGRVPLDLTDNQRALLFGLAEDEGEFVAPQTLGRQISANAAHPDQVVRKAMFDLEDRIRASAKDAGVELPEAWVKGLVEEKRGKGYRITLGVVLR
jgi:DNA-binding response OmpR family regulator